MRQSTFTETQTVSILKETDAGRPVNEIWWKYGIGPATYCKSVHLRDTSPLSADCALQRCCSGVVLVVCNCSVFDSAHSLVDHE